jgi:hypothetical protein
MAASTGHSINTGPYGENTDLNWSFTTFAFAMGSVINLPSCFNDEIPWW